MALTIVTRAEWGARPPAGVSRFSLPSAKVYIHHTAGSERGAAGMRRIQADHMRPEAQGGRGFRDIAYSFVIDGDDGVIYEGRGAGVRGGHVLGAENNHHGVCVMGNFEHETLTDAARRSLAGLLRHGRDRGWWQTTVVGHRDAPGASTACPGRHLYARLPDLRRDIVGGTPQPQEDDMTPAEANKVLVDAIATPGHPFRRELAAIIDSRLVIMKVAQKADVGFDPDEIKAFAVAVKVEFGDSGAPDQAAIEAAVRRVFADAGES